MDLRDRFHHAATWLEASPAEMAGLLSLLLGGVALTLYVVLVPRGLGVDVAAHAEAGSASEPVVGVPSLAVEVTVHVVGAVAQPGLVVVPLGSRVADAIAGAGGATPDAELGELNLARPVGDGEQIVVPRIGEATPVGPDGAAGGARRADGKLDLNAATAAEFEELPGVGPVLAGRIVDWREQHGPFTEVGQLREVAGIGEKTFQALSELVTV